MQFDIQPILENDKIKLLPLQESDFDSLYAVASDKKIWEQHPNKDRWQEEVFRNFFEGAIKSKGAYKIIDKSNDVVIGSTRFYDYDEADNSIQIGYTFYSTKYWGTGINPMVKKLMLDYAFRYVDKVYFVIGADNLRSQIAIGRIGAKKIDEKEMSYYGEPPRHNFIYEIKKADWQKK
ncbi:Protein N-acetyltransferase, RimJ/RimL family [Chitinophaga terrae (ex Kim and Jung 2007)]|jgi:RimJ/RimL family protein N-acetyltransferase|uniref:Protein N-acetyltransferase, RimJ/RimL family n=1 Tax=Chitinophaga terrae (ex Kim and Jung 2007) TaxID=408074 RepID=A0A1H4G3J3_9BACT|nr:GNAT family N-acetyltransferase [Chitinophaga terrae (ex Kim and Jung 2007)]MDQ0108811.1 RimJ/RimL family protein N-acetyltransferase [Chitinophaga terrae (ex Kim and Jung 2007)]GEP93018.1 acetyltransferase [Chitinophaga terrae (ex Kim and Jung 2007)]SEB03272.1 Protein N-acetyltransferase, RimJ/RimL family [Chitinophaga terrae (ex Kim and Jung 2007)]